MNDILYWIWLSERNGAGCFEAVRLLEHFEDAKEIYEAPRDKLLGYGCSAAFIKRLSNRDLSSAEQILEFCFMNGIRVVPCNSPSYPIRLKDIYNKPIVLYIRGEIEDLNKRFCVGIVGTRSMSGYGKHMTFTLARQLIAYGAIIISGAAYGIDSAANNTAVFLDEPTVAVLGSGVNVPYPQRNKEMLDRIAEKGMVISEFPPNTPPYGRNFPIRNRIISGLCDAVVIVEAGVKSGALITARDACDQGRVVYAVPGNVGAPNSEGTNYIIRDGGRMVTRAEDIIEDFMDRFPLGKIDHIINSDQYLRYEYNSSFPVLSENRPLFPEEQDKVKGVPAPNVKSSEKTKTKNSASRDKAENTGSQNLPPKDIPQIISEEHEISVSADDIAERERILNMLGDIARRVYNAIPDKLAVTTDKITRSGLSAEKVMASLTMLELYSVVEALPGGLYRKLM